MVYIGTSTAFFGTEGNGKIMVDKYSVRDFFESGEVIVSVCMPQMGQGSKQNLNVSFCISIFSLVYFSFDDYSLYIERVQNKQI